VSAGSMTSRWVAEEYAAMLSRAVAGDLRLVPVLYGDAALPPMLANRQWVDFRGAAGPDYRHQVCELAAALRGERRSPPPRGGGLKAPPGDSLRAEGPLRHTLRIGPDEVSLLGGEEEVRHRPDGLDGTAEHQLWELERARRGWTGHPTRSAGGAAPTL